MTNKPIAIATALLVVIDELRLEIELSNVPTTVIERKSERFTWHQIVFVPHFDDGGVRVKYYKAKLENLFLKMIGNRLVIYNSLAKYTLGNNYSDFSYRSWLCGVEKLSDALQLNNLCEASIHRLAYGCNIEYNPEEVYGRWGHFKSKITLPMHSKGMIYGAKFQATDYSIKAYDKTLETLLHYGVEIDGPLTRVEVSSIGRHLRQRSRPLSTVADLMDKNCWRVLQDDVITKHAAIVYHRDITFDQKQKPSFYSFCYAMGVPGFAASFAKRYPSEYKRFRKPYRDLMNRCGNALKVTEKIRNKLDFLIES